MKSYYDARSMKECKEFATENCIQHARKFGNWAGVVIVWDKVSGSIMEDCLTADDMEYVSRKREWKKEYQNEDGYLVWSYNCSVS